jgi:hypothetical protein
MTAKEMLGFAKIDVLADTGYFNSLIYSPVMRSEFMPWCGPNISNAKSAGRFSTAEFVSLRARRQGDRGAAYHAWGRAVCRPCAAAHVRRQAGTSYAAAAALFVHKAVLVAPSPPEIIAKSFKLTPSELRVLLAIVEVGGRTGRPVVIDGPWLLRRWCHRHKIACPE